MNLTEKFISKQSDLRGAELKGFMQPGNNNQLLLLFEKDGRLMALNITEHRNGDNSVVDTELDYYEMLS